MNEENQITIQAKASTLIVLFLVGSLAMTALWMAFFVYGIQPTNAIGTWNDNRHEERDVFLPSVGINKVKQNVAK